MSTTITEADVAAKSSALIRLIMPHRSNTEMMQRINAWCLEKVGKKVADFLADKSLDAETRVSVATQLVEILDNPKRYDELPTVAKGQATPEVKPAVPTPPLVTPEPKPMPAPKPAPQPEPEPEPEPEEEPATAETGDDPAAIIMKQLQRLQMKKSLTRSEVEVIVAGQVAKSLQSVGAIARAAVRNELAAVFRELAAGLDQAEKGDDES